jgi:hypothetical protein
LLPCGFSYHDSLSQSNCPIPHTSSLMANLALPFLVEPTLSFIQLNLCLTNISLNHPTLHVLFSS